MSELAFDGNNNISSLNVLKSEAIQWIDIDRGTGTTYQLINDSERLEKAAALEKQVWNEEGYGSLDEYNNYIAHSRTFAGFDSNDECVGVGRIFQASEAGLPPFINEMPYDDSAVKEALKVECTEGLAEEFGTVAVPKHLRNGVAFTYLARLSYRDAMARGVKIWGIIREPELVAEWNEKYGFTFKQVGQAIDYQGGMCAAHIMDLEEVDKNMSQKFPEIYDWFVNQPLGT